MRMQPAQLDKPNHHTRPTGGARPQLDLPLGPPCGHPGGTQPPGSCTTCAPQRPAFDQSTQRTTQAALWSPLP